MISQGRNVQVYLTVSHSINHSSVSWDEVLNQQLGIYFSIVNLSTTVSQWLWHRKHLCVIYIVKAVISLQVTVYKSLQHQGCSRLYACSLSAVWSAHYYHTNWCPQSTVQNVKSHLFSWDWELRNRFNYIQRIFKQLYKGHSLVHGVRATVGRSENNLDILRVFQNPGSFFCPQCMEILSISFRC